MKSHTKSIVLAVLGVILLGMSIAYASLRTNLSITGTANTPAIDWDIKITSFQESSKSSGVTVVNPTITDTSITNLGITLPKPGDSVVYTFKIVNNGTIDAKLDSYTGGFTCDQNGGCSNITYTLTCSNDATLDNSILHAKNDGNTDEASCTLTVQNNEATVSQGSTTYHQDASSGSFNANWSYVQN